MKPWLMNSKRILTMCYLLFAMHTTTAGGLLTNTNQSAQFGRMLSRNASTQLDAIYYNPAGLAKFDNGWFFSINNQGIQQNRTLYSDFPLLNEGNYTSKSQVLVFPSLFALYKIDNWGFSVSYSRIAGGFSENFKRGLPSYDIDIAKKLNRVDLGISGYNANISFLTASVYHGIQLGATFTMSEAFSVFGGFRYITASRSYDLQINNIRAQVNGKMVSAADFFMSKGNSLKKEAVDALKVGEWLQKDYMEIGAGNLDLVTLFQAGYLTEVQKNNLVSGLIAYNIAGAKDTWTVSRIKGEYEKVATAYNTEANDLLSTATQLAGREINVRQTGDGWTPIMGLNFSPSDNMNISARYEYRTRINLINHTQKDDSGLFPDGEPSHSDIPGLFALGIGYKISKKLETQLSYNTYFDKDVGWGFNFRERYVNRKSVKRIVSDNMVELAVGLQFNMSDNLAFSLGGLSSTTGISDSYQSDFSYSNPSYSYGFGFQWKITEELTFDTGFMNTIYKDAEVNFDDPELGNYKEVFGNSTKAFSFGLTYNIFK